MQVSTLRIVSIGIGFVCVSACSKNQNESFNFEDAKERSPQEVVSTPAKKDSLSEALVAASAPRDDVTLLDDPAAARECPSSSAWQKFEAFAAACAYVFTTDANQLPNAPEWSPCSSVDIHPTGACKQLKRSHRIQTFHVGLSARQKTQIGFVETCGSEQIVLADIDGPTRFALRRTTNEPTMTCSMKLLAVDHGQWLAAFGEPEPSTDGGTSGYTAGGAFLGGSIGSAAEVLLASSSV